MKAAKTIDTIYGEAKNYDIVISNDAALVTALNNRIDTPKIGRLASTPRMIARDREDAVLEKLMSAGICTDDGRYGIMDDVRLLESVSDLTGYDIRFVHGEIENIREIRRHTKEVEKYLFGKPSKKIYKVFAELPTYEMVMSHFDPAEHRVYEGKKVAVIGLDLFDDLDKHFIPMDFDEIDMFCEGTYDIGTVHAVGNDRQVAEHAADLITNEKAEDIAIVMDTKGAIADAVRSALYRKGIGFKNTLSAKDIVSVRDYMEFIKKSLSYEILTVGDVRELYASYGAAASSRYDDYLLNRYSPMASEKFRELSDIMKNIGTYTFSELCDTVVRPKYAGTVKMVLDGLGLSDRKIDEKNESSASYLIRSMDGIRHNAEIPDSEKRGVLLADCSKSVFIDRPFVIYLNIDAAWSKADIGKEYVDRAVEEEKNIQRFQVLLQQGSSRMYIVNTMKNGKAARPCTLFDELNRNDAGSPKRIDSFSDIMNTEVLKGTWHRPSDTPAMMTERISDIGAPKLGNLSKSSMNVYIACPRAYMFGELVRTPDTESTVFGNMLHEFAEFYLCYPDMAEKNTDVCTEMISEVCAGISCPERRDLDRSRITMAVANIAKFISSLDANAALNVDARSKKHKNKFFERFGVHMTSDIAERDMHSERCPLHGQFDLIVGNKVIDYKTGRPLSVSEIAAKMDITRKNDYYEVQPLVYLSILDDILAIPGTRDFVQFYALDNETGSLEPGFDIMRNARTVTLLNMRKSEIVRNGTLLALVTAAKTREFIREFADGFNAAILEAGIENAEDWAKDEELFEKILALQEKRTKSVMKGIRDAIRKAGEYMSGRPIKEGLRILLARESVEDFKEFARKVHAKIEEQQVSGFPCEPRNDCKRCGAFHLCTGGGQIDAE